MDRLLIDLSHTSHTRARTGIQRVVRSLHGALGNSAVGITFDPYRQCWRALEHWERSNLRAHRPGRRRGASWPLLARIRGVLSHALGFPGHSLGSAGGLVVPEIFSPAVARAMPLLLGRVKGPRVALFHDAIALKLPELTPSKTVARFPAYLDDLLGFDGVAAVSEDSRDTLIDYWRWAGVPKAPAVVCIPLGIDAPSPRIAQRTPTTSSSPVILSVGSIEARKNHLALLNACDSLWARGLQFKLRLIGHPQAQTGRPALDRIRELKAAGRPVRYDGATDDAVLEAAYAECAFTVYPSMMEGFGLPVLESLARRKPCICSAGGALGESARDGGCLTVADVRPESLAAAITTLLTKRETRERLADEAGRRQFRTWADYAGELTAWMTQLPRTQHGHGQAFRLP